MSEISPNAVSLESDATIESQPITQDHEPDTQAPQDDAEPEGVVEHNGQRMVSVSVLAAERRRARETTAAAIREKELAPLQREANRARELEAALAEVRPIMEQVRQYGIPKPPPPSRAEDGIDDDDAASYARDLELYDAKTGQPDIQRAKRIMARTRQDTLSAAQAAAQAAVGPITSQTAQSQSRQNFAAVAMERGQDGQPIAPPGSPEAKLLAEMWVSLPAELTAHREVGELIRDAAIGKSIRTRGHVPRAERGPTFSEPAGGRTGPQWEMDRMAKSLAKSAGISDKDFTTTAKTYTPGATNILGD